MAEQRLNKLEGDVRHLKKDVEQLKEDRKSDQEILYKIYNVVSGDSMGYSQGIIENDRKQDERLDKICAKIDPVVEFCESEKQKRGRRKRNIKWIVSVGSGIMVFLGYVFDLFKKLIALLK